MLVISQSSYVLLGLTQPWRCLSWMGQRLFVQSNTTTLTLPHYLFRKGGNLVIEQPITSPFFQRAHFCQGMDFTAVFGTFFLWSFFCYEFPLPVLRVDFIHPRTNYFISFSTSVVIISEPPFKDPLYCGVQYLIMVLWVWGHDSLSKDALVLGFEVPFVFLFKLYWPTEFISFVFF